MTMTIYFVAGEASADNHGAALMGALGSLNSNLRFIGRGGPRMKEVAGDSKIGLMNPACSAFGK
jgi:lipid-A-disaccharide synthase